MALMGLNENADGVLEEIGEPALNELIIQRAMDEMGVARGGVKGSLSTALTVADIISAQKILWGEPKITDDNDMNTGKVRDIAGIEIGIHGPFPYDAYYGPSAFFADQYTPDPALVRAVQGAMLWGPPDEIQTPTLYAEPVETHAFAINVENSGEDGALRFVANSWPDTIHIDPACLVLIEDAGKKLMYCINNKVVLDLDNGYAEYAIGEPDHLGRGHECSRVYLKEK